MHGSFCCLAAMQIGNALLTLFITSTLDGEPCKLGWAGCMP